MGRYGPPGCTICRGGACRGGGVRHCAQRAIFPSVLAGIIDTYGGVRFIVERPSMLHHHKRHDEHLIVVPDLTVREPVAWGDNPYVIARIELNIDKWADGPRPNEPAQLEAWTMYRLRRLEDVRSKRSLNLDAIATT